MVAPEGALILYETSKPMKEPNKPKPIEPKIILLKSLVNMLAMVCGMVKNEITSMIPTTRMFNTIAKATSAIIR